MKFRKSKKKKNNCKNIQKNAYSYILSNKCVLSQKSISIVLPIDIDLYPMNLILKSINNILNLNHDNTLYLVYNTKSPNVNGNNILFIKFNFTNIYSAYNLIIEWSNDDYITFLSPGDFLIPETYDIYQIYHLKRIDSLKKLYINEKEHLSETGIYDLKNNIPNNINIVYDTIYKISLLKDNKIDLLILFIQNQFLIC